MTFRALVALPFCIALAIQGVVCSAVLVRSETLEQMETDAYDLFSERVASRAGYLENDMIFRWSDFDPVVDSVTAEIDDTLAAYGATSADIETGSDLALSIVEAVSDDLLSFLRRAEVDGAYIVLTNGDEGEAGNRSAFYVRDSNPKVDVGNGSDLMLAACPLGVGRQLGITLDSMWSATFPLAAEGDGQSAFYYQPLRAAERYPDASTSDLGYWGRPVDLGWAGTSSITYSLPIKDAQGGIVGVVGVEVRLDRVSSFFPYRDLNEGGNGSYVLAVTNEDGGFARDGGVAPLPGADRSYEVLSTTGASQSLYLEDSSFTASLADNGCLMVNPIEGSSSDERAVAAATEIQLYDSTSPFASEHWALVGLEREDELFSASKALAGSLGTVFVVSLVVGLVIAVATAWVSSSRLRHLMSEVRAAQPEQPISFTPTGIVEVDELSEAIESMGTEVALTASRLSRILRLSDRGIGAFEYSQETEAMTYTDGFFSTLSILEPPDPSYFDPDRLAAGSLSASEFVRLMEWYAPYCETEDEGRYLISGPHRTSWVRLVVVESAEHRRILGLVEDVTHEIETRRRIEHERDHDILTGLFNRRAFEQEVTDLLAERSPAFGAMLMLDLDNLKFINDIYGHDWGDLYIKEAGRVVDEAFRDKGFYSRISGDEFLVFVDVCPDRAASEALFDTFRTMLDASSIVAPDGKVLKVRASMGVAFYPEDAVDYAHLREYADFAMYLAKSSRKGDLFAFDKQSYDEKSFIVNNKEDLNRLLEENLVEYHFQPIVDLRAGEVVAYEALMRSQLDTIPTPDQVIALARSQSKLYRVEHLTFFGALEAFSRYPYAHGATLFVNSIATQRLSADDELVLCERYPSLLKHLVIEITESDYSREMSLYKEALAKRFGARLAIDDFGSGYNGETSLLDYHVDFVKIDMEIVRGIDAAKDHQDIARNLIVYAHDRGIRVIAEGVETEAELRALRELGADYVQGYLTGRPAPEPRDISDEVKRLIRSINGTF